MKQLIRYISLIGIALIMHGCGGDGGGGSNSSDSINNSGNDTATLESYDYVAIDQKTAKPLASMVYSKITQASNTTTNTASFARTSDQQARHHPSTLNPVKLSGWAASNWQNIAASSSSLNIEPRSATPRTAKTEVEDCDVAGKVAVTVDTRNDEHISSGDKLSVDFDNCDDGDGAVYDGNISFVFNSYTSKDNYSMTMFMNATTRDNKTGQLAVIKGELTVTVNNSSSLSRTTVSSSRLYMEDEEGRHLIENMTDKLAVSSTHYQSEYSAALASDKIKGKVIANTNPAFIGQRGKSHPDTGMITITGANRSYVQLNADTGNNATLYLTVYDGKAATSEEISWKEIESPKSR